MTEPLMLCLECKKLKRKILLKAIDCLKHEEKTGHHKWKMVKRK